MQLTTVCSCGRKEITRVYGTRIGERYESPGMCANCQIKKDSQARIDAWQAKEQLARRKK